MNYLEIGLLVAIAFCIGWIAHACALTWWNARHIPPAERVVFAQMPPDDRRRLVDQLERINALRPKHRRVRAPS